MHIAETFKYINSKEEYNIFDGVDTNTYKQVRKEMISCVILKIYIYYILLWFIISNSFIGLYIIFH